MIRRVALALLLFPFALPAQTPVLHSYSVNPDVSMRIWVPAGKVRVDTWDRDSVRVTGTVAKGAHFFGGGSGRGAKMGIEPDDPANTKFPTAELVVTVPRKAHVWVKMTDGEVTALNTAGELEVITVTGTIVVQDASGIVSVETIDAPVTLAGIQGEVRVRGGGGKITLRQIRGTLTVGTVSGVIDMTSIGMQDARLETISGGITVRGSVARDAVLDLETHSGPIILVLDRTTIPALSLTTRTGMVRNSLGAGNASSGKIIAHSFKGDINVVPTSGIEGKKAGTPP